MKQTTRWLALCLALCLTLPTGLIALASPTAAAQTRTFQIAVGQSFTDSDGAALGAAFLDENGRMLVPLRALAQQMDLTVT